MGIAPLDIIRYQYARRLSLSVNHKWRILFDFVCVANGPEAAVKRHLRWPTDAADDGEKGGTLWKAPDHLSVETMQWEIPIKVYPANPHNVALTSTYQTSNELVLQ